MAAETTIVFFIPKPRSESLAVIKNWMAISNSKQLQQNDEQQPPKNAKSTSFLIEASSVA